MTVQKEKSDNMKDQDKKKKKEGRTGEEQTGKTYPPTLIFQYTKQKGKKAIQVHERSLTSINKQQNNPQNQQISHTHQHESLQKEQKSNNQLEIARIKQHQTDLVLLSYYTLKTKESHSPQFIKQNQQSSIGIHK